MGESKMVKFWTRFRLIPCDYPPSQTFYYTVTQNEKDVNATNFKIRKSKLTRVPESLIAKFFNGEDFYLPIIYDETSSYFVIEEIKGISMETQKLVFRFLDCTDVFDAAEKCVPGIIRILTMYGILENQHYTVVDNQRLKWNAEYVFKNYTNSELSEHTQNRVPT